MIWPIVAAGAGAVGLNYRASKELDEGRSGLPSIWGALLLGTVTGLWIGVSFSPNINSTFSFMERWFGVVRPEIEDDTSSDEDDTRRRRKSEKKKNK